MLMNLDELRNMNFSRLSFDLAKKEFVCPDQDISNILLRNKVKFLDKKWNIVPNAPFGVDFISSGARPSIVHWAGGLKPWLHRDVYCSDIFWKFAEKSIFFDDLRLQYLSAAPCTDNAAPAEVAIPSKLAGGGARRVVRILYGLARGDANYWEQLRKLVARLRAHPGNPDSR